ncbi:glycosyltransferase [Bacteroidota bacterium]
MKKVLFISYFWPPAAKASMYWQLKVVQHLPGFGWEPVVLTVENESFEARDDSLLTEVNPNLKIIRTRSVEPFNVYRKLLGKDPGKPLVASETMSKTDQNLAHKLSLWVRLNLFVPDARVGWYLPAVKGASAYLKKNKIDAIVSIGPPHSCHLINYKLSKKFGIPSIPLLQDPWFDIVYYRDLDRSKLTQKIDKRFEQKVLKNSAQTVFVNHSTQADYISKYDFLREKSNVLYWGYNEEHFKDLKRTRGDDDEIIIVHSGNLFDYQNPRNFWSTIKRLNMSGRKVKLKFTGTVSPLIKKEIEYNDILKYTEYLGVIPYPQMLQELMNADILMVCPTESRHVPGKLFEYLRTGNPILAFNDKNDEVRWLIEESNAGKLLSYSDDAEEFLKNYKDYKHDVDAVKQYDRKLITEKFSHILNKIVNKSES